MLLVIPVLLMNVVADQVHRHAVALEHDDQARERFPAVGDEVRRTLNGTGSTGVIAVACPTTEAAGQFAGFASNTAAGHAFCSVVSREGRRLGSSTLTALDVRLASWPG